MIVSLHSLRCGTSTREDDGVSLDIYDAAGRTELQSMLGNIDEIIINYYNRFSVKLK